MGKVTWQDNSLISYDQWLVLRLNAIGASEVAAIVVGNKYTSNLEIFYQKVGAPSRVVENLRMYIGKETEELSSKFWKHYAGTEQSVVDNIRRGTPIRDCVNLNATAFNTDYPQLSVTPDRKILPVLLYEGMGEGALEIKNSNQMVLDGYTGGIPTDNIYQIITQMMVTTWKYGELFYFLDNRTVKAFPILRRDFKKYEDTINQVTRDFWINVLKARPLYNQMHYARRNYDMRLAAELEQEIIQLEPPPQNTDGYLQFLTDRYKAKMQGAGIIKGTDADLQLARKMRELDKKADKIEAEKKKLQIALMGSLKENHVLDFGKAGRVTWIPNKNGARSFKNLIN